jgi:hypothetical protein
MPLSKSDPNLDYDGSWGDASVGWPEIAFSTEEVAVKAYVIAWRDVKVPYGSYVLVGNVLRLETEALKEAVLTAVRAADLHVTNQDTPSDVAFRAIVRSIKDSLPLTTTEDELRLAIAKGSWEMALKWTRQSKEEV